MWGKESEWGGEWLLGGEREGRGWGAEGEGEKWLLGKERGGAVSDFCERAAATCTN